MGLEAALARNLKLGEWDIIDVDTGELYAEGLLRAETYLIAAKEGWEIMFEDEESWLVVRRLSEFKGKPIDTRMWGSGACK